MNKKSWNHFTKNLVVALTLIFLLGYTNATVYGVSFPDYFPLDPASHGVKTFQWTYGRTGSFQSYISGTLNVPYTSGSIEGTGIVGFSDTGRLYATNDGSEVKWLATDEFYISTDPDLTAHPAAWTFSTVTDDMLFPQGICYFVDHDLTSSEIQDDQVLLFDIQDVTVLFDQYNDAVIIWYLDEKYSFTELDFNGRDIGITLPIDTQTGGDSVTAFDVYASGIGMIASGDIDAESGKLVDLAELVDINFSGPVAVDIVPDTISTKTKWITCHIWPSEGYDVANIKTDSILLNGDIQPVWISDKSKQQKLVVKFPTSELTLNPGTLELTVSGDITDGPSFAVTDSVEVVKKGGKPS